MRNTGMIDSVRRTQIEEELLGMMRRMKSAGDGFEVLVHPGEEPIMAAVIQNIMERHPEFSLVSFPSGPAIVRRRDVDAINPDFKRVNESTGFIVHGGDSFEINDVDPRPLASASGTNHQSSADYQKNMPNAAEAYGIPELGLQGGN